MGIVTMSVGETFSSGIDALKKRYGPLTGWQYGTIVIGGYVVFRFMRAKSRGQAPVNRSIVATPNGMVDTTQFSPSEMALIDAFSQGFQQLQNQISAIGSQNGGVNPINPGLPSNPTADLFLLASNLQLAASLPQFRANANFLNRWASDLFDMGTGRAAINNTEINGILSWLHSAGLPVDRLIDVNAGQNTNQTPSNNAPVFQWPLSNPTTYQQTPYQQPMYIPAAPPTYHQQFQPFAPALPAAQPQVMMLDYNGEWVTQAEYNMRQALRQPGAIFGPPINQQPTIASSYMNGVSSQGFGGYPAGYFTPGSPAFFTPAASAARNTVAQTQYAYNLNYQRTAAANTQAQLEADIAEMHRVQGY